MNYKYYILNALFIILSGNLNAIININISENIDGNTVFEYSGQLVGSFSGLIVFNNSSLSTEQLLSYGSNGAAQTAQYSFTTNIPWSSGSTIVSSSGDTFSFWERSDDVVDFFVPFPYSSGAQIDGILVVDASMSQLGITPGSSGVIVDGGSDLGIIYSAAVPEPSTYAALLGIAILGLVWMRRLRVRKH